MITRPMKLVKKGERLLDNGHYWRAANAFKKAMWPEPTLEAAHGLGAAYARRGKWSEALGAYSDALTFSDGDPRIAQTHADIAVCHFRLGEYRKAAEHFETSIRLGRKSAAACYNLGVCHVRCGLFEMAEKNFMEAIALGKDDAQARRMAGYSMMRAGKTVKAYHYLLDAIKRAGGNGDMAELRLCAALSASRAGGLEAARRLFADVIREKGGRGAARLFNEYAEGTIGKDYNVFLDFAIVLEREGCRALAKEYHVLARYLRT